MNKSAVLVNVHVFNRIIEPSYNVKLHYIYNVMFKKLLHIYGIMVIGQIKWFLHIHHCCQHVFIFMAFKVISLEFYLFHSFSWGVTKLQSVQSYLLTDFSFRMYSPNTQHVQDETKVNFFMGSLTGLNSDFSFL